MSKKVMLFLGFVFCALLGGGLVLVAGGYLVYQKVLRPHTAFASATNEMVSMETAEMDLRTGYEMKTDFEGDYAVANMEMDVEMEGTGKIDVANGKLEMTMSSVLMGETVEVTEILIGNTAYLKLDDGDYEKISLTGAAGAEDAGSVMTVESFQEQQTWGDVSPEAEYEYIGEEEMDGEMAYHYKIGVSDEELEELYQYYADSFNSGTGGAITIGAEDVSASGISFEAWVRKSDSMPLKEKTVIENLTLSVEDIGDVMMNNIYVEVLYKNVNEPVEIVAPEM